MVKQKSKITEQSRNIGARIRAIRERENYTQEHIAEEIGIHVTTYGRIEADGQRLGVTAAMRLCELFRVSLDDLLGFNFEQNPVPSLVRESRVAYGVPKSANIVIQVGGEGGGSPSAEAFMQSLGRALREYNPDDPFWVGSGEKTPGQ